MQQKDPKSENIFHCLASYTPRENRTATEDFCTEALAWCLRNSKGFRQEFLLSIPLNVKNYDVSCVDTQRFFHLLEHEKKGRLDMVVESEVSALPCL
jgi:hypothetical protein